MSRASHFSIITRWRKLDSNDDEIFFFVEGEEKKTADGNILRRKVFFLQYFFNTHTHFASFFISFSSFSSIHKTVFSFWLEK